MIGSAPIGIHIQTMTTVREDGQLKCDRQNTFNNRPK
jgi:hypothetical protein